MKRTLNLRNLASNMMVKAHLRVASGADRSESRVGGHGRYYSAAVLGRPDCYVVSEGGSETSCPTIIGLVAA